MLYLSFQEGLFQVLGGFIVHDMYLGWSSSMRENVQHYFHCICNICSCSSLDGFCQDGITIIIVTYDNILVLS